MINKKVSLLLIALLILVVGLAAVSATDDVSSDSSIPTTSNDVATVSDSPSSSSSVSASSDTSSSSSNDHVSADSSSSVTANHDTSSSSSTTHDTSSSVSTTHDSSSGNSSTSTSSATTTSSSIDTSTKTASSDNSAVMSTTNTTAKDTTSQDTSSNNVKTQTTQTSNSSSNDVKSVNATTNDNTLKTSSENSDITTLASTTYVTVSDFGELRDAIDNAHFGNYGDDDLVITLTPEEDTYWIDDTLLWGEENEAQQTKKLTIIGNGVTLEGQTSYKFLEIYEGYTVILDNVTIHECYYEDYYFMDAYGGAIENHGNLTISNSTFDNNHLVTTMGGGGGAIGNTGTLTISDTTFIYNKCENWYGDGQGGVIYNAENGNVTLINCEFEENEATSASILYNQRSYDEDPCSVITFISCEFPSWNNYERDGYVYLDSALLNIIDTDLDDYLVQIEGNGTIEHPNYAETDISIEIPDRVEINDKITIEGILTGEGNTLSGKTIILTVNGEEVGSTSTDGNGAYSFTYDVTSFDSFTIMTTFDNEGDFNYQPATSEEKTVNVNKRETTLTVEVDDSTTIYPGDIVTITGTLEDKDGYIDGQVTIDIGDFSDTITITGGEFTYIYTVESAGSYEVKVTYGGDSIYDSTEDSTTFTVEKLPYNLTAEVSRNSISPNGNIVISGYLLDGDGNPFGDDIQLTITIETVDYEPSVVGQYIVDVSPTDGSYNLQLTAPGTVGDYTITVTYYDDNQQPLVSKELSLIVVNELETELEVNTDAPTYNPGDTIVITGTLTSEGDPLEDQEVIIYIGEDEVGRDTTNSTGGFTLTITPSSDDYSSIQLGSNNVRAVFEGSVGYLESDGRTYFTFEQVATYITIDYTLNDHEIVGQQFDATIQLFDENDQPIPGKTIKVTIDGNTEEYTTTEDGIKISYTITSADNEFILVEFAGDDKYIASYNTTYFNVDKRNTTLKLDKTIFWGYAGRTIEITGTLFDEENQPVSGVSLSLTVDGESVTYTTTTLENGNFVFNYVPSTVLDAVDLQVSFSGNDIYKGCSINGYVDAEIVGTTLELDFIDEQYINKTFTVTGTLTNEFDEALVGETVVISVGDVSYNAIVQENGSYSVDVVAPSTSGTIRITATYDGKGIYQDGYYYRDVGIDVLTTQIEFDQVETTPYVGDTITISGRLTDRYGNGVPSALVSFDVDMDSTKTATTDNQGYFSFELVVPITGINTIDAYYEGMTSLYRDGTGHLEFEANHLGTDINVDGFVVVTIGEIAVLNGTLVDQHGDGIVGEIVHIYIDDEYVGNATTEEDGLFSYSFTPEAVTDLSTITVKFDSNDRYVESSTISALIVEPLGVNVTVDVNNTMINSSVVIAGTLFDENDVGLTGTVTITVRNGTYSQVYTGVPVTSGEYSYSIDPFTSTGIFEVVVEYDGDETHLDGMALTSFDVEKIITQVSVETELARIGQDITITGEVRTIDGTLVSEGTITVKVNGEELGTVSFSNGVYTATYTPQVAGESTVEVSYSGTDYYTDAENSTRLTVNKIQTTLTFDELKDLELYPTDNVIINATLVDEDGKPVVGATVIVVIDDVEYVNTTDENGKVHVNYTISEGFNSFTATYDGNDTYYAADDAHMSYNATKLGSTLSIDYDGELVPGSDVTIYGTLRDENGHAIVDETVTLIINGEAYNVTTNSTGGYSHVLKNVDEGSYTAMAIFSGDDEYTSIYSEAITFDVAYVMLDTSLTVQAEDTIVNTQTMITGQLTTEINGQTVGIEGQTIIVKVNGVTLETTTPITTGTDGTFTVPYTPSEVGTYIIEAIYEGLDQYTGTEAANSFQSTQLDTQVTVDVSQDTLNPTDSITIYGDVTSGNDKLTSGSVTLYVDGVSVGTTSVLSNGSYEFNYQITTNSTARDGQLSVLLGNHIVEVMYNPASIEYASATDDTTFYVERNTTSIVIDNYTDHEEVHDNVEVVGRLLDANGDPIVGAQLTYIVNNVTRGTLETGENGNFTISYEATVSEIEAIIIRYDGDEKYVLSYGIVYSEIDQIGTSITPDTDEETITTVGAPIEIRGVLTDDFGILPYTMVYLTDEEGHIYTTRTDENGHYIFEYTPTSSGSKELTISYAGEEGIHEPTTVTVTTEVNKAVSSLTNLTVDATGINGTLTITGSLTDTQDNQLVGETVTITITGDNYTYSTSATVGSEGYLLETKAPSNAGTYNVTVSYAGSSNYESCNDQTSTFTLVELATEIINQEEYTTTVGSKVTITGELYDENNQLLTGATIRVLINGSEVGTATTNEHGVFTYDYTPTSAGSTTIQLVYDGDNNYKGTTSTTTVIAEAVPTKTDTQITIGDIEDITIGDSVTITGTLMSTSGALINDATLTVTINGEDYTVKTDANGVFTISNYKPSSTGTYVLTAQYNGNGDYNPSIASTKFNVAKLTTTITLDKISDIKINDSVTITGVLEDNNGVLANKEVTITINDETYTATTNSEGKYSLTYKPEKTGAYSVVVEYAETANNTGSYKATAFYTQKLDTTITVDNITAKEKETINLTAHVLDENGNPVSEGQVAFKLNDVTLKDDKGEVIYVDVIDGVAQLEYTINNTAKNYTITGLYYGSDNYNTDKSDYAVMTVERASIDTTITVEDITAEYGDIITLTAKVVDDEGNLVNGGKVAFKLNGVTIKDENGDVIYAQVIDGYASINYTITNNPKDYVITASYSGSGVLQPSRSEEATLTVLERTVNVDVDQITGVKSGDKVTLKAIITDKNSELVEDGVVVFKINGKTLRDENGDSIKATVVDGVATLDYDIPVDMAGKDYNITAVYSNKNYERTEANNTLTVERSNVQTTIEPVTITQGENATIKATLYDENGDQLERSTKVAIKINGKTVAHTTTENGVLNVEIPTDELSAKDYNIEVVFGENSAYYELRLNSTLHVV